MKLFDNVNELVRDDMFNTIKQGSKVSIAASCFSIYAYKELKNQLESIESLRFIFTSPTFITEKDSKKKKEFYIPKQTREKNLYGTEFEIKLRNEMTQKAIAKECADWIRRKVTFKSNTTGENMGGFITVENQDDNYTYMPINGFTTVDIGCERGNNAYNIVNRFINPVTKEYLKTFEAIWSDKDKLQDVTETIIDNIATAYNENAPELIYFITLFNVFSEFLEDISEDVLPNEATGFKNSKIWGMLYNFQKDAVLAIINKMEKYNGCILADSVGLGKTFTALAVIKYYEGRNNRVLVLCPKKLSNNWNTYKGNYINNPIASDRLSYDVLFHTDLNRTDGTSNGLYLDRINWSNYDLIVIDESHNFRNGIGSHANINANRYAQLMNNVIRKGVKTKVLMLSATPVNNRFNDLKNQLALAYEGKSENLDGILNTKHSIDDVFKRAQQAFNEWCHYEVKDRTTENLLKNLDFDFFEILDSVTIARSRKHIQKYYDTTDIGTFPKRLLPISKQTDLTSLSGVISYNQIFEYLMKLTLSIYTPSLFIYPSRIEKYSQLFDNKSLTQIGRERGIRRLTAINLMKRLESSVYSFNLTMCRIKDLIEKTIASIENFDSRKMECLEFTEIIESDEFDDDDQNDEVFSVGKKVKIDLDDIDYKSWKIELEKDRIILEKLIIAVSKINSENDSKLQELFNVLKEKILNPINENNKKIIIFTAFADTANYLYEHVSQYMKKNFNLETAMISGSVEGKTTVKLKKNDLNTVLTCFSPISKNRDSYENMPKENIDILIATDCISEGQNLQDCDYLVNYDIHWNPVRIIQRFGRIDRIGSKNKVIQLVNFWPNVTLDEYIDLKAKVETRMKIVDMTATGDDNIISPEEKVDLEYRKKQLEKLKNEVVDIEEMSGGISIMDLGLNEFRLDLLEYIKNHDDLKKKPFGLHSVVPATDELPEGVIFVLKNRNNGVNIDNLNRIHPFYMVYIGIDGEIVCDYLNPKKLLDTMRLSCRGKSEPIKAVYQKFNDETKDGRDMSDMSSLLSDAITSIIDTKEESDIDSLFKAGGTSALMSAVSGLDDFELICFLVVK